MGPLSGSASLTAYGDESKTEHCAALAAHGLTEFHASLCCTGKKEYAPFGEPKCDRIWREFGGSRQTPG
jgi:hypothetical protein